MKKSLISVFFIIVFLIYGTIAILYDPWEKPEPSKLNGVSMKDLYLHQPDYEGLNITTVSRIENRTIYNTYTLFNLTDGKYNLLGNFTNVNSPSAGAIIAIKGISYLKSYKYILITKIHEVGKTSTELFSIVGLILITIIFFTYFKIDFHKRSFTRRENHA